MKERATRPPQPRRGDRVCVYVPELDGAWVIGTVSSVHRDGLMVVVAGAKVRTVNVREYLEGWAWPEDMPTVRAGSN